MRDEECLPPPEGRQQPLAVAGGPTDVSSRSCCCAALSPPSAAPLPLPIPPQALPTNRLSGDSCAVPRASGRVSAGRSEAILGQAIRNTGLPRDEVMVATKVFGRVSMLVGEDAGSPNEQGQFPAGSVNARVVERLRDIAAMGMEDDDKEEPAAAVKEKKPRVKKVAAE